MTPNLTPKSVETAPIQCGFCSGPAVWRWKPANPPAAYNQFACDDHAATIDLDELESLDGCGYGSSSRPCGDCKAGRHDEDDEGNCGCGCGCAPVEQTRSTGRDWWSLGYGDLLEDTYGSSGGSRSTT